MVGLYNLPADVVDTIFLFDGRWADERRRILDEFELRCSLHKLNFKSHDVEIKAVFGLRWAEGNGKAPRRSCISSDRIRRDTEISILEKTFSTVQLEKMFVDLNKCHCCLRHQADCPQSMDDVWDEQSIVKWGSSDCRCPCRHLRRVMALCYSDITRYWHI